MSNHEIFKTLLQIQSYSLPSPEEICILYSFYIADINSLVTLTVRNIRPQISPSRTIQFIHTFFSPNTIVPSKRFNKITSTQPGRPCDQLLLHICL
ncbi:hypothetical protein CDAR_84161 [Caerostris darwini]|uniref:Uncharacterized protein n=1 Tax=Caerostris darwini TaxID=1538125 RepID=A0AAV4U691_9ARAC|nr:hypothetical protein CDAR_84161 [Caerostris darwini]